MITRTNKPFTILTNDPSMTGWGWAVIRQGQIIAKGCIKTIPEHKKMRIRKGDDTIRRASEIIRTLIDLIQRHHITFIVSEQPHGSQNASAAVMVGMVTGILQTIAETNNLGIEWYSEMDTKKFVLGKRSAAKQEMVNAMYRKFTLPFEGPQYVREAIADALAVYATALGQSPTLKLLMKQKS